MKSSSTRCRTHTVVHGTTDEENEWLVIDSQNELNSKRSQWIILNY